MEEREREREKAEKEGSLVAVVDFKKVCCVTLFYILYLLSTLTSART